MWSSMDSWRAACSRMAMTMSIWCCNPWNRLTMFGALRKSSSVEAAPIAPIAKLRGARGARAAPAVALAGTGVLAGARAAIGGGVAGTWQPMVRWCGPPTGGTCRMWAQWRHAHAAWWCATCVPDGGTSGRHGNKRSMVTGGGSSHGRLAASANHTSTHNRRRFIEDS
jgi:hypothetical protein